MVFYFNSGQPSGEFGTSFIDTLLSLSYVDRTMEKL